MSFCMDLNYVDSTQKNNKYITFWQSNLMMDNPNFWRLPTIINSFFAVVSLVQFSAAVCHQRRCLVCDLNAVMIYQVAMNQATSGRIGRRIWENSTCRYPKAVRESRLEKQAKAPGGKNITEYRVFFQAHLFYRGKLCVCFRKVHQFVMEAFPLFCFSHLFGKLDVSIVGASRPLREGFLLGPLTTNLMKMNPNKHEKTTPSGYCEVSTPPKKSPLKRDLKGNIIFQHFLPSIFMGYIWNYIPSDSGKSTSNTS